MGYAIAQAAFVMGAEVTLVSGATTLKPPRGVKLLSATSADAMYQSVMQNIVKQDIFISVAAVADYSPAISQSQKIKKSKSSLTLELKPNKDVLAEVASLPSPPFCVGFAAETDNLLEHAEAKRQSKRLPLIVANLMRDSMGQDENTVTLLDDKGAHTLARASKNLVAEMLLKHIADMLKISC
jgi:phosphopantothenoylcysteine decarboxylase/phosphopantothenate--cysteine ligase